VVHRVPFAGFQARPIGLRSPEAKIRLPLPSGLNSVIAARIGLSLSTETFEREPTATYIFVPLRLKITLRVEWPPGSSAAICNGLPREAVCPGV
jgi:hypothetical protein